MGICAWRGMSPRSMAEAWPVPIVREALAVYVQGYQGGSDRELVGGGRHFEHGGAFVHLVEHGGVKHGAAGAYGVIDLAPVEGAAVARDLVEWTAIEVVPGEPGENDRHVIEAVELASSKSGIIWFTLKLSTCVRVE